MELSFAGLGTAGQGTLGAINLAWDATIVVVSHDAVGTRVPT